jgi:hypothetical protein
MPVLFWRFGGEGARSEFKLIDFTEVQISEIRKISGFSGF